jgi:hypothetical protein
MRARGSLTTRLCRLVAMTLVAAGAWGRPAVADAQAEIPPEVRQALEQNARSFAPIALTLQKQRSAPEPSSELARKIIGKYFAFDRPCTYEYLSQDGLCYARTTDWVETGERIPGTDKVKKRLDVKKAELSWDGKCAYQGMQNIDPPILTIVPIAKAESDRLGRVRWYDDEDYLAMIGIAVPRFMKELPEGPRSQILHLLESDGHVTGARAEHLADGTEHFVVELLSGEMKHRFWLDPSLGHAVRRHEVWAASGALAVVIDSSDFVKLTDPELWLPKRCHAQWHTWPLFFPKEFTRETAVVVEIQATRLERVRVPPETFTLHYTTPGAGISDAGLPGAEQAKRGRIDYRYPADPANLEEAIRAAQEKSGYVPPRRPLFLWIIAGSIALGVAVIAIVLIRRRRGRPATR